VQTGVPFGGAPATWITERSACAHADLIAMATLDRSGPNRWLHGSVAEAVVSHAGVPVLLIRAAEALHPIECFGMQRPELVVPLDGLSLAEAALPLECVGWRAQSADTSCWWELFLHPAN
jgi:hypothetical protein